MLVTRGHSLKTASPTPYDPLVYQSKLDRRARPGDDEEAGRTSTQLSIKRQAERHATRKVTLRVWCQRVIAGRLNIAE